jgi:Tfp pilus assembly protein PilE
MVARQHLHQSKIDTAKSFLCQTLDLCEQHYHDSNIARFLPQTYSDLAYLFNLKGEYGQSVNYYREALQKAREVQNPGNVASIQCRMEATKQRARTEQRAETEADTSQASSWAQWAFCRPFS